MHSSAGDAAAGADASASLDGGGGHGLSSAANDPGVVALAKAAAICPKEIVKNQDNSMLARSRAITVMVAIDPKTKAFASKYVNDDNAVVREAAKQAVPAAK